MILNKIELVVDFINSILAPIPGFARGYVVIFAFGVAFWMLGAFGESSDDEIGQIRQGVRMTSSGLNQFLGVSAQIVASGVVIGGRTLAGVTSSVGRGMWSRGSDLVEVEEAPIKVGPLVEIYGVKIGIGGLIVGLLGLGGLLAFSGGVPFLP